MIRRGGVYLFLSSGEFSLGAIYCHGRGQGGDLIRFVQLSEQIFAAEEERSYGGLLTAVFGMNRVSQRERHDSPLHYVLERMLERETGDTEPLNQVVGGGRVVGLAAGCAEARL